MQNLKSLADQLREELGKPPAVKSKAKVSQTEAAAAKQTTEISAGNIFQAIQAFDNSAHKSMVHVRFDKKTIDLMNRFKLAAGVDITKLVAFAVHNLFENHPELKQMIKQYLQNLEL